jgi:hypothetical protein
VEDSCGRGYGSQRNVMPEGGGGEKKRRRKEEDEEEVEERYASFLSVTLTSACYES